MQFHAIIVIHDINKSSLCSPNCYGRHQMKRQYFLQLMLCLFLIFHDLLVNILN